MNTRYFFAHALPACVSSVVAVSIKIARELKVKVFHIKNSSSAYQYFMRMRRVTLSSSSSIMGSYLTFIDELKKGNQGICE